PYLYTLSLHDALPISYAAGVAESPAPRWHRDCGIWSSAEHNQASLPRVRTANPHYFRLVFVDGICASGRYRRKAGEAGHPGRVRSEEHTSELQSRSDL